MYFSGFTLNQLINQAKISQEDLYEIHLCRKEEMQLGFAYGGLSPMERKRTLSNLLH